ncbi:MAG TPA: aldehyde dehydrogenase family protein [Allosphingosinicella sp.]|nr:aldehyde dehydrogenase family protein [Allosphingosinicella sp.]
MTVIPADSGPPPLLPDDAGSIARLGEAFARQREAFGRDRAPGAGERRARLQALIGMLVANRARISAAIASDFGAHPAPASDLIEVLGVIGRAHHALANLDEWMRPDERSVDPAVYGSAAARMELQPKGVIGNIVPWNFPFDLSVGPLVDMLAAGNRVILKPSEYTPACGALLSEMIAATFDPDLVTVVLGGIELARAFAATPWDHLLYTGSPDIARQVMAAAAANLTPVTLELGGKCPAIILPGAVTPASVESVLGTKTVKNGQMCVSPDYCLVPRGEVEAFLTEARAFMDRVAPAYSRSDDCTGIISQRHFERLADMLVEVRERQARIVELEDGGVADPVSRRMPMALVVDPPEDTALMREEIFGPILPVLAYDHIDDAIARVNAGERPLALYVFGEDLEAARRVLEATTSGGAAINTCAAQSALPSLGFGGSGASGMGRHHGIEGFREFSNQRGVVTRGTGDIFDHFYVPYGKAQALVGAVLGN